VNVIDLFGAALFEPLVNEALQCAHGQVGGRILDGKDLVAAHRTQTDQLFMPALSFDFGDHFRFG
jgi:hypothetical protein